MKDILPPMKKKFKIEVEKNKFSILTVDDSIKDNFDLWPMEMQIDCLNTILILYNLHLIPEDVYFRKYKDVIEKFSEILGFMKDFAEINK